MSLAKGALIMAGAIVGGAAVCAAAPVVTVSAPFWGIMGTTYAINGTALAGAASCAAAGAGLGKIAGQTGGSLVIQGMDNASQSLMEKLRKVKVS